MSVKEWSEAPREIVTDVRGLTCLLSLDHEGRLVSPVPALADRLGWAVEEVTGLPLVEVLDARQHATFAAALDRARHATGTVDLGRYWLDAPERASCLLELHADPGVGDHLVVAVREVTDSWLEEMRRRALRDRLGDVASGVETHVTQWSRDLDLAYHSAAFEPLLSVDPADLVCRPGIDRCGFTELAAHTWRQALRAVVSTSGAMEFDWETVDGAWIHARAIPEFGADGFVTVVTVVGYDVDEARAAHEARTAKALTDPLTGLDNRAAALAHIGRALTRRGRTATSEACVHIDLDRFRSINDSLGHEIGDEVLLTVGKRLRSVLRPHDVVARIGGDEFVIFLQQMPGIEQVLLVVERLRGAIGEPLTIGGREIPVRTSVGIAFAPERSTSADELLADAVSATAKAKELGRDRVEMHDEVLREQAQQRMKNELALKRAMRNGEMEVHLLPDFDLVTRTPLGAEALIRWQHPERGLVPAAEFIALAEETGLLVTLGNEVLRRSCELVAGWLRTQPLERFTLRVNLSARQLAQATLVPQIAEAIEDTKLDPEHLCLELSEGSLVGDPDECRPVLHRLRDLGVRIAIDDFGRGTSTLEQLKSLPVDLVLIDRSFVRTVHQDPRDEAIVKAIVEVTAALGVEVAAVGIDDEAQLAKLLDLGCTRGQGYLLSEVVRPNEFMRRFI